MLFFESIREKWNQFLEKWNQFREKIRPVTEPVGRVCVKVSAVLRMIWSYVVQWKKLIAAIPVAVGAIWLAVRNTTKLPAVVGLGLQMDGSFSLLLPRQTAVLIPLSVTALCLLLMCCSKRILTPWVVSALSLILPVIIWVVNVFPS